MEIEAKFDIRDLEAVTLRRVLAALAETGIQPISSPKLVEVHDSYYDTQGLALYHAGAGLRLRSKGGKTVLTLKIKGSRSGAVFSRQEIEGPVEHALITNMYGVLRENGFIQGDPGFRPELENPLDQFSGWGLEPVVQVYSERKKCLLTGVETFGELAYDLVYFEYADRRVPHPSLEVEALEDRFQSDIEDLAEFLMYKFGSALVPQAESKYALAVAAFGLDSAA